LSYRGELGYFG